MRNAAFLASMVLVAFVSSGSANDDRYVLERSGDDFVRMDRESGAMSFCRTSDDSLVCRLSADERAAYQDEIDRLQTAVTNLEDRVSKLEGSASSRQQSDLPSSEEFKTTLGYMEQFMRTFMGVVKEMDEDGAKKGAPVDPNKT